MTPTYFSSDSKIDYLLRKFRDPDFDDYTRAHMANYLCVLLSGLLETAIRERLSLHCESRATPAIANFVKNRLEGFRNPDPESIARLIGSFDRTIADKLDVMWADEIKDAIGSIVGNRHLIAHGRDTSLTLSRVSDWFQAVREFIIFLELEFA
jgi:hypothetical protein